MRRFSTERMQNDGRQDRMRLVSSLVRSSAAIALSRPDRRHELRAESAKDDGEEG